MKVFVTRHGNTFGSDQAGGEKVFVCGSKNNIPLVETGRNQARLFAKYLDAHNIIPNALYANHLIRTWEYAVIIKEYFLHIKNVNIPLYKEQRLLELDYGDWAGLTEQEVIDKFGNKAWDEWQTKRLMQNNSPHNWKITEPEMVNNIKSLFADLSKQHSDDETLVLVGSQGSITFLNTLFPGGMQEAIKNNRIKTKTGCFAELIYEHNNWQLVSWNQKP